MAGVESIQCPKCGSPLEVTPSTFQARCSYCGSVLRVSRDASGQPLAVLDDIREDTDILATDVVRRRLEERLRERLAARYNLGREYTAACKKAVRMGGEVKGALLIAALVALVAPNARGIALMVGFGIALAWIVMGESRRRHLAKQYVLRLHKLEADIAEAEAQLRAATVRMDGLIRDAGGH